MGRIPASVKVPGQVWDSLANCRSAIIDHLTSRVVGSFDDPDAAEVITQRTAVTDLEQRDRADQDAWDAGAPKLAAAEQRWDYLRGELERVGREIVSGHRLPGGEIGLVECLQCGRSSPDAGSPGQSSTC